MSAAELLLLALINDEQGSSIAEADIAFGTPSAYAEGDARGDFETVVTVSSPNYRDTIDIRYFRIDLGTLFSGINVTFPFGSAATVADLVPLLNQYYGLNFDASFVDGTTAVTDPGNGDPKTAVITAAADNHYLVGTITVTDGSLPELLPPISDIITATQLNGFYYDEDINNPASGKVFGKFLTYPVDFTTMQATLSPLVVDDLVDATFTADFADVTGQPWVFDDQAAAEYNLSGGKVVFNGTTADAVAASWSANTTDFVNICIIDIDEAQSTSPLGRIYLHYVTVA